MKIKISVWLVFAAFIANYSCCKDNEEEIIQFEIFGAKNRWPYNAAYNYNTINLDTIELWEEPFITLDQIARYDASEHIIRLYVPKTEVDFPELFSGSGQLFVIKVNDRPVYCGFIWNHNSSVSCRWIIIWETPDGLAENEVQINLGTHNQIIGTDPRNDSRIIDALRKSGKLIYSLQ